MENKENLTEQEVAKELNDKELNLLSGGNYGDKSRKNFGYWLGSYVEVYDNFFHTTTTRAKITDVKDTVLCELSLWTGDYEPTDRYYEYYCEFDEKHKSKNGWYTSSDIQR